ncbi:hypothetical protein LEP1GSC188_1650 [Leptospira weilii serovar Topaz str. LT2116]|uniref:Uncharacterized protein n=1 Tax=Leptospira weilii serovar Topaz str. LT2116 TaxID=1088540 RepID=M3EFA5_9LEPT|nr:hypothetical protein LEP1GSC188_1650 [Leptospira weilii serovar Topaz str. LT2116]
MSSAQEIHDLFLKCGNYNKSRFYEQILKVGILTFRKSFLILLRRTHIQLSFFIFNRD